MNKIFGVMQDFWSLGKLGKTVIVHQASAGSNSVITMDEESFEKIDKFYRFHNINELRSKKERRKMKTLYQGQNSHIRELHAFFIDKMLRDMDYVC